MATKHHILLGILLIALCLVEGFRNRAVKPEAPPAAEVSQPTDKHQSEALQPVSTQATVSPSALRRKIIEVAKAELGVREATDRNDGPRVEQYLRYTDLGKGYAWCAAFVSWVYGQVGLSEPRNPWSPALFPNKKSYCKAGACDRAAVIERLQPADLFGIYGATDRRINHVGLVKERQGKYLLTIEGNSNNRVESRRRHLSTIYALANWLNN